MISPLDLDIDGLSFQSLPHKPTDVLKLDKVLLGLIAPALSGLGKNEEGKLTIDFTKSAGGLAQLLIELPDEKALDFYVKLLSRTTWLGAEGAVPLNSTAAIDRAFANGGSVLSIYKLVFAVLKHNKFSFFALQDFGVGILRTLGSTGRTANDAANGSGSAPSEN